MEYRCDRRFGLRICLVSVLGLPCLDEDGIGVMTSTIRNWLMKSLENESKFLLFYVTLFSVSLTFQTLNVVLYVN